MRHSLDYERYEVVATPWQLVQAKRVLNQAEDLGVNTEVFQLLEEGRPESEDEGRVRRLRLDMLRQAARHQVLDACGADDPEQLTADTFRDAARIDGRLIIPKDRYGTLLDPKMTSLGNPEFLDYLLSNNPFCC